MNTDTVAGLCAVLIDEAVVMWHRDGAVMQTLFAIGNARSMFAQPVSELGFAQSDEAKSGLHALLAGHCNAHTVGRIDEVFYAEHYGKGADLEPGDLSRLAETDPNIRTAITINAYSKRNGGQRHSVVAVFGVGKDARPMWRVTADDDYCGDWDDWFTDVFDIARHIRQPLTDAQLSEEVEAMHWALADSDDAGDDE